MQKLKGKKSIWDKTLPLDVEAKNEVRWARKAIGSFRKEAQGGPHGHSNSPNGLRKSLR